MSDDRQERETTRHRPSPARDTAEPAADARGVTAPPNRSWSPRRRRSNAIRQLTRIETQQSQQVATAAGNAVVSAARVGRLLGRSGWRIARQLPGVDVIEKQTEKLRQAAAAELVRMLELPQGLLSNASPEEARVMMLVHNSGSDPEPLRSAMTELLQRAREPGDGQTGRDYLYGTIVSQLVPDEARILAALAGGRTFAAVDVVAKDGRRAPEHTVLSDVSTVGVAAGVTTPANTPAYVGRLRGFGLVDIGPEGGREFVDQYVQLADDPSVSAARAQATRERHGSVQLVRHTLRLSRFGAEFWKACAPSQAALGGGAD